MRRPSSSALPLLILIPLALAGTARTGPPCASERRVRRVFLVDILTCAPCQGRLRVVAKVDNPDAVQAMLRHLGLLYDPEPDRAVHDRDREPQLELAYDFGA